MQHSQIVGDNFRINSQVEPRRSVDNRYFYQKHPIKTAVAVALAATAAFVVYKAYSCVPDPSFDYDCYTCTPDCGFAGLGAKVTCERKFTDGIRSRNEKIFLKWSDMVNFKKDFAEVREMSDKYAFRLFELKCENGKLSVIE